MNAAMPWLEARRAEAQKLFRASGVPTRRMEDWRYTDLNNAIDVKAVEMASGAVYTISCPDGVEMIVAGENLLPDWMTKKLGDVGIQGSMSAAALAYSAEMLLRVAENHHVEKPIALDFVTTGNAGVALFVGANASVTLSEVHRPYEEGLRNFSLTIFLEPGARLDHVKRAAFAPDIVSVETITVIQSQNSTYRAHFAQFGSKLSRTELQIALEGEGSESHLSGVSLLKGDMHADVTTHVTHSVGHTQSIQLFKNAAHGRSRAVYQGRVTVKEGANGSDSRQTAKGILLGQRAEIDLKPELEIFADDVKCAHGAAVGDLEAEQLFYLRARGLPEAEARNLLIRAFLEDAVLEIADEAIRAEVWRDVETALEGLT